MALDTRKTALHILLHAAKKKTTLDRALDAFRPQLAGLTQQDKNLCHAIVFGVLRHRNFLDFIIQAFSNTKIARMDLAVLYILRMAIFQMRFLDRVPDFATINTAVDLAKARGGKKIAGFVNAVLRNAARKIDSLMWPDRHKTLVEHISVVHSIPLWLAQRWLDRYGPDTTLELCRYVNQIPPVTLRTNTLKTSRPELGRLLTDAGHKIDFTQFSPDGILLAGTGIDVEDLTGFAGGLFQIQDEAAQLVSRILDPQKEETILDACAGLGGKTLHLAQLMENTGQITAVDTEENKLAQLASEAQRLGITCVETRVLDLRKADISDFPGFFDRVLVDAPCTGLGVLRRNPDTKWERSVQDIQRMAARQKRLLNRAANLVKPGGTLVYAVCSCEKEENEEVVAAFLKARKDYVLNPMDHLYGRACDRFFTTFPDTMGMDGFFAARFTRVFLEAVSY
ncbi:MAG: 16S rRNA (cytosine(967)-C(5))-methyltransferase RsmB [Desulfotignum sp.]